MWDCTANVRYGPNADILQCGRKLALFDHLVGAMATATPTDGWAILKTRNQITGAEFIHRGDESTFTAQSD
jgi:hypothetical protein